MNIKRTNPGANVPEQTDGPLGDRGGNDKTWSPPKDEQGISNRRGDEERRGRDEDADSDTTDSAISRD
jgi:hypothetical protein